MGGGVSKKSKTPPEEPGNRRFSEQYNKNFSDSIQVSDTSEKNDGSKDFLLSLGAKIEARCVICG